MTGTERAVQFEIVGMVKESVAHGEQNILTKVKVESLKIAAFNGAKARVNTLN